MRVDVDDVLGLAMEGDGVGVPVACSDVVAQCVVCCRWRGVRGLGRVFFLVFFLELCKCSATFGEK